MDLAYQKEIEFWDKELSLSGDFSQDIMCRLDRNKSKDIFPLDMVKYINERTQYNYVPKLLDIGSGPLSLFLYGVKQNIIQLTCLDPLADEYESIRKKYGYDIDYKMVKGSGEMLTTIFKKNTFDIIWIRNALDHCQNPKLVIKQIRKILKKDGYLVIEGCIREGTRENWSDLHKHDLFLNSNKKICCDSINIDNSISHQVLVSDLFWKTIESSDYSSTPGDWMRIVVQKKF